MLKFDVFFHDLKDKKFARACRGSGHPNLMLGFQNFSHKLLNLATFCINAQIRCIFPRFEEQKIR